MNEDRIARLERLAKLRENGNLSQQEFNAEKARVLNETEHSAPPKTEALPEKPTSLRTNRWLIIGIGAVVVAAMGLAAALLWSRVEDGRSTVTQASSQAPVVAGAAVEAGEAPQPELPSPPIAQIAPAGPRATVPPKITGDWRNYRTRIREGWGTAPDFAGRYVIIRIGCGTGCTFGIVGDHQSGELYDLGLGGEEQMYLNLRYGNGSNTVNARWDDYANCFEQDFNWSGTNLNPVGEPQVRPRGEEPCRMNY